MQIKKIFLTLLFMTLGMFIYPSASFSAQNDPVAMLQYIANNMIAELKTNKATLKNKPQIVYRLAYKYVVPHANLSEMSKRVLPPQIWNSASSAQRVKFQKEFTNLLIRTYASALTSYQDQVVEFYPVRGGYQGMKNIEVNSQITGSGTQPIRVTYRLIHADSWQLYDMSVEGVDMLESFRAQFADILSRGNMEQLIQQLAQHNRGRR